MPFRRRLEGRAWGVRLISDFTLMILGAFAGGAATWFTQWLARYVGTIRPTGELWSWLAPDGQQVELVVSTGAHHAGEYTNLIFPTEAEAAAEIKNFLGATLRRRISIHQSDGLGDRLDRDLVLIGGPVNNAVTERVLALPDIPFKFENHTIVHEISGQRWHAALRVIDGRSVVWTDYCLIARIPNPFNRDRGLLLIGGSRAYGTLGGARMLLRNRVRSTLDEIRECGDYFAAIVETPVMGGEPGASTFAQVWPLHLGQGLPPAMHPTSAQQST